MGSNIARKPRPSTGAVERMGLALVLALTILFTTGSPFRDAKAQEARPIRFWVNVSDFGQPHIASNQYQWTADTVIPVSIVGWTCKTKPIVLGQFPAVKAGNGLPASAAVVYQSADIVCSSKCGTVSATAMCTLSAGDEHSVEDIRITDSTGHHFWIGAACRN